MSRRYTYATTMDFGTDGEPDYCELEVAVSYLVYWGAPEQGPSYASGGQPADPDEIDDIRLEKVNGNTAWGHGVEAMIVERLEHSERDREAMLIEAAEEAAADYHEAMECRAELRAERLREDF